MNNYIWPWYDGCEPRVFIDSKTFYRFILGLIKNAKIRNIIRGKLSSNASVSDSPVNIGKLIYDNLDTINVIDDHFIDSIEVNYGGIMDKKLSDAIRIFKNIN